jgi:hypothetical protein
VSHDELPFWEKIKRGKLAAILEDRQRLHEKCAERQARLDNPLAAINDAPGRQATAAREAWAKRYQKNKGGKKRLRVVK